MLRALQLQYTLAADFDDSCSIILKGGQERGIRGSVNNASYFIPVFTSRVVNGALACWAKYGYSRTLSPR